MLTREGGGGSSVGGRLTVIYLRFKGLLVRLRGIAKPSECLEASKGKCERAQAEQRMRNKISNVGRKAQGTPYQLLTNTHNLQCDSSGSMCHGHCVSRDITSKSSSLVWRITPSESKRGTEDAHEEVFASTKLLEFARYHRCLSRWLL
jgi:hypothetical protein